MNDKYPFLKAAENRESFFRRIELLFPKHDYRYRAILRAYDYAKDAFREKYREGGDRYFEHVRMVTLILIEYLRVKDYRLIIAALLHDCVEDCKFWSIERVFNEFGEYVAMIVGYLTKPPVADFGGSKVARDHAYHERFSTAPREFFLVKLSDRLHNILTMGVCSKEKRMRKVQETKLHYLPHAERHWILYHEIKEATVPLEQQA